MVVVDGTSPDLSTDWFFVFRLTKIIQVGELKCLGEARCGDGSANPFSGFVGRFP